MNRGLYIGSTSLVANQRKMDVLSNNLANINTTGYKKDFAITESFPEKLLAKKSRIGEFRRRPVEDNLEYENLDNNTHNVKVKEGYFRVETPRGESFVKEINFIEDEDGYLKTSYRSLNEDRKTDYENYILDKNGNRVQNPGDIEGAIESLVYSPRNFVVGTMSAGVNFKRIHTDFTQGGVMDTGGSLDIALMGEGFIKLQGEDGVIYTRNGSFSIDTDRNLVDLDGRMVLGTNNQPITINGSEVNISENGTINVDGDNVGQIGIVQIGNKEFLRKIGDNNFRMAVNNDGEEIGAEEEDYVGRVLQGHLETSNMNAVTGMVEMISLMREFEANQKVVRMQDEMLEKATTELGRV